MEQAAQSVLILQFQALEYTGRRLQHSVDMYEMLWAKARLQSVASLVLNLVASLKSEELDRVTARSVRRGLWIEEVRGLRYVLFGETSA